MPQIGPLELVAVLVVALVVFGPERLPEMARKAGRMLNELRRMASDVKAEFSESLNLDDEDEDDEVGDEPDQPDLDGDEDEAPVFDDEIDDDTEPPPDHPLTQALAADRSTPRAQEEAAEDERVEITNRPSGEPDERP
jgi:sec-independent protein translocase protein TatB